MALAVATLASPMALVVGADDSSDSACVASSSSSSSSSCSSSLKPSSSVPPRLTSIIDVTATVSASLPSWLSSTGLGAGYRTEVKSHKKGDKANSSELRFNAHTGTHIDAPRHFVSTDPTGIDEIPLDVINGPALLIEAYGIEALTAEALASLHIPDDPAVTRLLFRTDNTHRGLMGRTEFTADYVGFTDDGAEWMVRQRPHVKAIGIDYLSIASLTHLVDGHVTLLGHGVVPIEGLVMPEDEISAGYWFLHCAPLKLEGSDGAPARAWLTPLSH